MGKSKLPTAFIIPHPTQVAEFINLCKPDWPTSFVQYLAQRFWDHYQSNGWIVGRVKMKDWKCCIRGQWLVLKFKEDKERLEVDLKSWQHRVLMDERKRKSAGLFAVVEGEGPTLQERFLDSLDEIFAAYKIGNVNDSQLRNVAEWLDRNNLPGVTPQQRDRIIAESGNDGQYRKVQIARQFFANLMKKEMAVKTYFYSKLPQNGSATKTA
jgi:hypothetical protein